MRKTVTSLVTLLALVAGLRVCAEPESLGSVAELEAFFQDNEARQQAFRIAGVLQRKKCSDSSHWELTVRDDSGRRVAFVSKSDWSASVGDAIILDGFASVFPNLETLVTATNITIVGQGSVDPPLKLRLDALDERAHDLREVIVDGTIADVFKDEVDPDYDIFLLKDGEQLLPVYFLRANIPRPTTDARVRVRGIFNRTELGRGS